MDFLELAFHVLCAALALYFAQVRFRARLPLYGHAMIATASFQLIFALKGLDLWSNISAAAFLILYLKSLAIIQDRGLSDGGSLF
jgi:hypothetical protein